MNFNPVLELIEEHSDGYAVAVFLNELGVRCGYVGIPKEHPCYGCDYDDIEKNTSIDVHGGLTYSGRSIYGIQNSKYWWIGFDCGHFCDYVPALRELHGDGYEYNPKYYWFHDEVYDEVMNLKEQIKKYETNLQQVV